MPDTKTEIDMETDEMFRNLAKEQWHVDGSVEIDDGAQISCGDPARGAYVQAWVWVDAPEEVAK